MEPSTRSNTAAPGESTITLSIKRTENLLRLFHVDNVCDLVRELPSSDPRRLDMLRYWIAERSRLSLLVNLPELTAVEVTGHNVPTITITTTR